MTHGRIMIVTVMLVLVGTWAYAADCKNGGRYEDSGHGTVTDCRTGMIWLKDARCTDTSSGIANPTGELTWYDAMKWVAGLHSGLCGLSDVSGVGDWRLPTKTEWMAMVAYARKQGFTSPPLTNATGTAQWTTNGDAFDNVTLDFYWSSTSYAPDTRGAYVIHISSDGHTDGNWSKDGNNFKVWPVRGGQSGSFGTVFIE